MDFIRISYENDKIIIFPCKIFDFIIFTKLLKYATLAGGENQCVGEK